MPEVGPFTPSEWETWLEERHESESEVWLVSWKKSTGRQQLAYGEAVEVAMKFGWVDSLEKGIDAERFKTRWTPRRAQSKWTEKNRAVAERLIASGEMRPAWLRAYQRSAGRPASATTRT